MTYKTSDNQTIFDLCIIIYGTLDYLVKLMVDNNLNFQDKIPTGTLLVYDAKFTPNTYRITTNNYLYK